MSPINIAILAAIGVLLMLLLIARRKRRRTDDDLGSGSASGWASPAAAPAPPPPSAPGASGAWVVGGAGSAAHEGPFAPALGAEPSRPPEALVTEPGWPLPDAGGADWPPADAGSSAAGGHSGESSDPGWFAPSPAVDPAAPVEQEAASATTGEFPAVAPAEEVDLAAAWASWTPEEAPAEAAAWAQDEAELDPQPVLAAAQQAAALTVEPPPVAPPMDREIADAFAAFAAAPEPEAIAVPADAGEAAWAPAAWEQADEPAAEVWEQPEEPAPAVWEQPEEIATAVWEPVEPAPVAWEAPAEPASAAWEQPVETAPVAWEPPVETAPTPAPVAQWEPSLPTPSPLEGPPVHVPAAARNTAPGEDVFAAFISRDPSEGSTLEPVAWWDEPDPEPAAAEAGSAPAGATTGRFALGGHALFPDHAMVGAVQFRVPRDSAPSGWSVDGDAPPAPDEIQLSVHGATNVAEDGVEVLTDPGFAPCEEGFTLRVRAADVGPVLVSGTYTVG